MIPQISFEEAAIVVTTMTSGMQTIYFIAVTALNLLGLYIQDMQIDKEKAKTAKNGDKPYELEWRELVPYAVVSAIFTMGILVIYEVQFWHAMILAIIMGMAFRVILVEIGKAIPDVVIAVLERIKAMISAILGKG
jgi:hypothetical protein